MNELWHHWFDGSWTHVIALSLAHFLWQGVLVGLVVASLDRLLSKASASSRYVLHLVALASLPVCFVLTMGIVDVPEPMQAVAVASEVFSDEPESAPEEINDPSAAPPAGVYELSGNSTVQSTIAAEPQESQVAVDSPSTVKGNDSVLENPDVARNEYAWLPSLAPIVVIAYLLGVAVFLVRLTLAVWGGHRLRSTAQPLDDSHSLNIVAERARRVGLRIVPVVALCERVAVPTVVGVVRPMVLLPASIITGLTPDQFATIISHELAHIRRYDLLVTLLQRTIESFFFFHPIVWYLSRRISRHREVCCDDLVVSTGHGPMDYAGALLRMAELCVAADPTGAIAATATGTDRSQFESRVTRLMTMTQRTQLRLTRVGAVLLGSLLIPLMTVPPLIVGVVQAEETEDADTVTGTLQVQMAVLTPGQKSDEDVNSGKWQVAVDWKVPIRTEGGAGSVISEIDGAILRIEWQAVRRHNGGLQLNGFNWSIDNPIDRRDGVSLGGIGGRQIAPKSSWFGDTFETLASMQLDTAAEQKSDRVLVFRARFLSGGTTLKRLSVPELLSREADELESESSLRPDKEGSDETEQLFQTAYDSDPSFGRASIKHTDQRGTIANWNRALQQDDLTRGQQIFAWWRIGSLAAYNFNAGQGEAADNDLAAEAFRKVLSIGNDLVCRETLNAATVYATLGGGTREDQASRMEFARQWLATRTDAMVVQSAWLVNHNGYGIDGRLMPGGMNLQTEAEKAEYLTKELANARESVAARAAMAGAEEDRPMLRDAALKRLADRLVAAAGSPTWKLHHVDKLPTVLVDDSLGYRITLRRTWEEYSSLPQQKETPPDELGPFDLKHEDWEFVLFPSSRQDASGRSDASTPSASASRLTKSWLADLGLNLWKTASSPYHIQAVCMGEGYSFVWYSLGTLFGQETIREKLKLTGGDDRLDLLIAGTQIEDEGNITANSCARLMERFGDEALGRIETAIEQTQEPTALRGLIGSLASIRTDAATKLLMRLHESDNKDTSAAADFALVHRPLRPAAKSAYLDMLLKHRHVDVACEGCVHFRWKEALPILVHLTSHPESLRELSWTIPARRELEGNPIEYELIGAKQTIIAGRTDPNYYQRQWETLVDSDDFEAIVLTGIELATHTTKGPQQRVQEAGIRLLLTRPRHEVTAYLQSLSKAMPAENAKQVQRLLRQLQQSEQLKRLQSHGILVTPDGIGGSSHRYVVPSEFRSGYFVINDLLDYCVNFSPKSEIVFFGPVITDDQFRQFHLLLPASHVRRMAAVWLNVVATVSDDERERRMLRVSDLGSPAREIGLQVEDVIVGIGPFRWPKSESRDAFNAAMLSQIPGQQSKIVVDRDGKVLTFPVTWEESTAHRLLCGDGMPTTQRGASQSAKPDVDETSTTDNIQSLTGKWQATEESHHLLDSKLVEANQTGFVIAIDKQFGESYRKTSDTHENQYREFLEQKGHDAVASGTLHFDYGGESELIISRKDGDLFLWYGVVTGGNPRISLLPGADKTSIDSLAIQWTSSCSDSPLDSDTDSVKVVYQRLRPTHPNQPENSRRLK